MEHGDFLIYVLVFLASAVIVIPLFKRFGLSAVLGYLAAGILIGPSGFGLVHETHSIMSMAELGVVFLLFIIGLELKPSRLWTMRKSMLGSGGMQMLLCFIAIFLVLIFLGREKLESAIIAYAVSLSSTALVLQLLAEQNQLNSYHGRQAFSVLLFQDLAVIPAMAILPFFATSEALVASPGFLSLVVLFAIVIGFHFLSRPVLAYVAKAHSRELFTSMTLFLVISVAMAMHAVHLSMELGAFLAGMMLSGSEYRHQLETDIEPFKGLLLGLFFMGIGMGIDAPFIMNQWQLVVGACLGLMVIKGLIIFLIGKVNGLQTLAAIKFGAILSQGGEFAFVLIGIAVTLGLVDKKLSLIVVPIVTLSMVATPFVSAIIMKMAMRKSQVQTKEFDEIDDESPKVIVAGLGRFGQITARVLRTMDIPFVALEHDPGQVEVLRRFGNLVYYGDGTRLDLLENAGAKNAKVFLVAIAEHATSLKVVKMARKHFPHLQIIARARNRQHVFDLLEAGANEVIRETFLSALEATAHVLKASGLNEEKVTHSIKTFREHDEELLIAQFANMNDQHSLAIKSMHQLSELLKRDDR